MSDPSSEERAPGRIERHGALAGLLAAATMTLVMIVLRLTTNAISLPELLAEGFIGLLPGAVFSALLDTLQKSAKPLMYVGIVALQLGIGALLGRGYAFGPVTWKRALKLGLAVWGIFGVVILPIFGLGLFGSGALVGPWVIGAQMLVDFLSFAVAMVILLRVFAPALAAAPDGGAYERAPTSRRAALVTITGGIVAIAVGGTIWRSLLEVWSTPPSTASVPPPAPVEGTAASSAAGRAATSASPIAAAPGTTTAATAGSPLAGDLPSIPMTVAPEVPNLPPFNLKGLTTEVIAGKDFYTVSKNLLDPSVNVSSWQLAITGLVDRPATLTYAAMTALPTFSDYYTLQCISNTVGGDLWGNAHWKGVRLRDLLVQAGIQAGVQDVVFHAVDDYTDSVPLQVALQPDALLAYEMNGEPLPKEHGYPARLLIPGIYGMKNVKWIDRIELVNYDFKGYWMHQGWSDAAPYMTESRIDTPRNRSTLGAGELEVGGVAFAGNRGIVKVEVSLDDGKTWEQAALKQALARNAWNLWAFRKQVAPGTYTAKVRATDGTGQLQLALNRDPFPDGASGYHTITIRVG
ncbi:MAG: molybdopterin-dependent oxidoreductase [Chloroflexi bacterium]|nr:molybdopterin-dependent oxidoreductase [Chloroflexota bacterium]